MDPNAWRDCYDQILFPIVSGKLKAAAAAAAGNAADEEVCIRSVLLLCRSFRQNLHVIILLPEMHMLWLRLLGLIEVPSRCLEPMNMLWLRLLGLIKVLLLVIIILPEMHMLWLRLLGLVEAFKHRIRAVQRDAVTNDVAMHSDPSFQKAQHASGQDMWVQHASGQDMWVLTSTVQHASGQDMWVLTSTVLETFCPDLKSELMPTGSTPNKPHRDSAAPTQPRWGGATEAPAAPGVATEVAAGVAAGVATPPPSAPSSSAPPVALLDPGGMPREAEVGGGAGAGGGMRGGLYPAMALNDSSVAVGDSVGAQMAPIEGLVPS
ncbi:hypothetical protein T484DRAFT_1840460 [Baffinella frigidus]|nr:hypothetical protein T484DRAFT_1840460 [Cryptophyta sp. CCMP2293]